MQAASKAFSSHRLTVQILIGMIAGAAVGFAINIFAQPDSWVYANIVDGPIRALAEIFVRSLQMLVVPLVFVSLVDGTSALNDPRQLGRMAWKTMALYVATTTLAVSAALSVAMLVQPGVGVDLAGAKFVPTAAPPVWDVFINMIPTNPVQAMASASMLQIIVFSILFGLAITQCGEVGQRVRKINQDVSAVVMRLVMMLMALAPIGVFALMARVTAQIGADVFANLAIYFVLVLTLLLAHMLIVYPSILLVLARLNPRPYLSKMRTLWMFAFSTSSSNATMPVTLRTVEKRLGVSNKVAAFTVPLGATINMDGTAIMQGVATVFIANAYGVDLSSSQLMTVVLMATLASIGTAGVPGVGLIMLAGVLTQVGLPVDAIGLVMGVDRLLDMTRTMVNVSGDAMTSIVVAKSEDSLDIQVFNDPNAGDDS